MAASLDIFKVGTRTASGVDVIVARTGVVVATTDSLASAKRLVVKLNAAFTEWAL